MQQIDFGAHVWPDRFISLIKKLTLGASKTAKFLLNNSATPITTLVSSCTLNYLACDIYGVGMIKAEYFLALIFFDPNAQLVE